MQFRCAACSLNVILLVQKHPHHCSSQIVWLHIQFATFILVPIVAVKCLNKTCHCQNDATSSITDYGLPIANGWPGQLTQRYTVKKHAPRPIRNTYVPSHLPASGMMRLIHSLLLSTASILIFCTSVKGLNRVKCLNTSSCSAEKYMLYCVPRTWEVRMMPSWKSSKVTGLSWWPPEFRICTAVFRIYRGKSVVSNITEWHAMSDGAINIHCL